jgi:hypothetical protein
MTRPSYQRPWQPPKDEEKVKRSCVAIAEFAVSSPELTPVHRRNLLNTALWWITELGGKYTTRYRSRGVLELGAGQQSQLRHEHVLTRQALVANMLAEPERVQELLMSAVGCVVTREEHAVLTQFDRTHEGWERYLAAGIDVMDMQDGAWFIRDGRWAR